MRDSNFAGKNMPVWHDFSGMYLLRATWRGVLPLASRMLTLTPPAGLASLCRSSSSTLKDTLKYIGLAGIYSNP